MSRFFLFTVVLLSTIFCSCSDAGNPAFSPGDEEELSIYAGIEIGGIAARVEHLNEGQSGPYYRYSRRDTTPSVYTYSFSTDLYPAFSARRDSGAILYTIEDYIDAISIRVVMEPDGNLIRALEIVDYRGSLYYYEGRAMHRITVTDIPRIPGNSHRPVFEVRGPALAAVLQHLKYELQKELYSHGPSWSREQYTMLWDYEITPASYLRITLAR